MSAKQHLLGSGTPSATATFTSEAYDSAAMSLYFGQQNSQMPHSLLLASTLASPWSIGPFSCRHISHEPKPSLLVDQHLISHTIFALILVDLNRE
jgi:hypothetical protein